MHSFLPYDYSFVHSLLNPDFPAFSFSFYIELTGLLSPHLDFIKSNQLEVVTHSVDMDYSLWTVGN